MGKQVAKLKVMCARSMSEVVTALAYSFTSSTGHEVELDFGTVGALQKKLDAGETADVLIIGLAVIDRMEKANALVPGSRKTVATTRIGVAVRAGGPAPDISTPNAFKQALVDARKIAFSDAAVGGSATASNFSGDSPGVDLGALQALVSECGGHLWMRAEPPGDMELKIHLPRRILDRSEQPAPAIPSPRSRWIRRAFGARH